MQKSFKLLLGLVVIFSTVQCIKNVDPIGDQRLKDKKIIDTYVASKSLAGSYLDQNIYKASIREGAGDSAKTNDGVIVKSKVSLTDGTQVIVDTLFYQHNQGFFFYGWEYAISTMKVGEKSTFLIPSELAYGQSTLKIAGVSIPANSVLVLDLELTKIINPGDIPNEYAAFKNLTNIQTSSSGVVYSIIGADTGKVASAGQTSTVKYTGYLLQGTIFDQGSAFLYKFGDSTTIRGWQEVIPLLKKGDKAKMIIPSAAAYRDAPQRDQTGQIIIPANAVLFFDVEIVDIK